MFKADVEEAQIITKAFSWLGRLSFGLSLVVHRLNSSRSHCLLLCEDVEPRFEPRFEPR